MFPSFTFPVILYGLVVIGLIGFLWVYYDRQRRRWFLAGKVE